jgi:hypothetical protein
MELASVAKRLPSVVAVIIGLAVLLWPARRSIAHSHLVARPFMASCGAAGPELAHAAALLGYAVIRSSRGGQALLLTWRWRSVWFPTQSFNRPGSRLLPTPE